MDVKKDFPFLKKGIIYLDSAATSQKPLLVAEEMKKVYLEEYAPVHRSVYDISQVATEKYNGARRAVASFINAKSEEEIVFTKGTTESINLVASSYGSLLKSGDEILLMETEHHSNIVPWQLIKKGVKIVVVPVDKRGFLRLDIYEKLLSSRTKIVAVAHSTNSTGAIYPVKEIIKKAHEKGALVLVDGAQAVAHMEVDVTSLDADFYVFSGHKMYGPTGIGVLYAKKNLLDKMGPYQGGGGMINEVHFGKTTYIDPPLRFEAGTPPFVEAIGLKAAIDYILSLGRKNIFNYEQMLTSYALKGLEKLRGIKILTPEVERGSLISFNVEGVHPLDVGTLLGLKNICLRTGHLCAQPTMRAFGLTAVIRISFGVYNTQDEVDTCLKELQNVVEKLNGRIENLDKEK